MKGKLQFNGSPCLISNSQRPECNRCESILQQLRQLLNEIQAIKENDVIGVCDHCQLTGTPQKCQRCAFLVNKFLTRKMQHMEQKMENFRGWMADVKDVLLAILQKEISSKMKPEFSTADLQKLLRELQRPLQTRQPEILYFPPSVQDDDEIFAKEGQFAKKENLLDEIVTVLDTDKKINTLRNNLKKILGLNQPDELIDTILAKSKGGKLTVDKLQQILGPNVANDVLNNILAALVQDKNFGKDVKELSFGSRDEIELSLPPMLLPEDLRKLNSFGKGPYLSKDKLTEDAKTQIKRDGRYRVSAKSADYGKKGGTSADSKIASKSQKEEKKKKTQPAKESASKRADSKNVDGKSDDQAKREKSESDILLQTLTKHREMSEKKETKETEKDRKLKFKAKDAVKDKAQPKNKMSKKRTQSREKTFIKSDTDFHRVSLLNDEDFSTSSPPRLKEWRNFEHDVKFNAIKFNSEDKYAMQLIEKEKPKKGIKQRARMKLFEIGYEQLTDDLDELALRALKAYELKNKLLGKEEDNDQIEVCDKFLGHLAPTEMIKGEEIVPFEKSAKVELGKQPLLYRVKESICQHPKEDVEQLQKVIDPKEPKGVLKYQLSNPVFIEMGWTLMPTEKTMRKLYVYKMTPATPKYNWFKRHLNEKCLYYDTGEKMAEVDSDGHGRWYYRNQVLALDFYKAQDPVVGSRYVVYSSGERDQNGTPRPITVLASFDHIGNGIVFDHCGNERLKYNQTEGEVIDDKIGAPGTWKWHGLNDPPCYTSVFCDTHAFEQLETIDKQEKSHHAFEKQMHEIEMDNIVKERSEKLRQKFKPFEIKPKCFRINEYFSLKIINQANICLSYADGHVVLKQNVGLNLLDHEIVDLIMVELCHIGSPFDKSVPKTESIENLLDIIKDAKIKNHGKIVLNV